MGQTKAELQRDLRYLLRLWESIQKSSASSPFPGLVYREADLVIRTIRDHLTSDIGEVWIERHFEAVVLKILSPVTCILERYRANTIVLKNRRRADKQAPRHKVVKRRNGSESDDVSQFVNRR